MPPRSWHDPTPSAEKSGACPDQLHQAPAGRGSCSPDITVRSRAEARWSETTHNQACRAPAPYPRLLRALPGHTLARFILPEAHGKLVGS